MLKTFTVEAETSRIERSMPLRAEARVVQGEAREFCARRV
jgi:hypothetical protein